MSHFAFFSCLLLSSVLATAEPVAPSKTEGALAWYDLQQLELEGKGWTDTKAFYDRLPAKAEGVVPGPVWSLAQRSAGLATRFVTDATEVHARWTLTRSSLAMPHMPATGVSGLDLYVKTKSGNWRWLAVGQPTKQTNSLRLVDGISKEPREYLLYLPLYNGVKSVELGIPTGATLAKAGTRPSARKKPIVFYGTSITQGACASRPGMAHVALLGRCLDVPVINLGFSGNGKMELELADLLAELDPAVFVLDCLPNMNGKMVAERAAPFVERLRKSRPDAPILLVEDRSYSNSYLVASRHQHNEANRTELKKAYEKLLTQGVKNLHYLPGEDLLGDDGEGTVDGSHPTDLGFVRQAEAFRKVLEPLLKTTDKQ